MIYTMTNPSQFIPIIGFLDERYEEFCKKLRIIFGCCLFGADRWMALNDKVATISRVRRRKRLNAIYDILNNIGGIAVLGFADVSSKLLPKGEIDATNDIPRMSRRDNMWGMVMLCAIYKAIALLQHNGISMKCVDLYYDQKSLSVEHRTQLANLVRSELPKAAKEAADYDPAGFKGDPKEMRFRHIREIQKPHSYRTSDPFQNGTAISHHLCSQSKAIINRGMKGRIFVKDFSSVVNNMIAKFA